MVCNTIRIFGSRVLDTTIPPNTYICSTPREYICEERNKEAGLYIQPQMLHDGK